MDRWLEILQDYDFEVQHRAGRQHGNADALFRCPCEESDCQNCRKQEEREKATDEVIVRQVDGGKGACDLLEPHELRRQQKEDPALKRLHEWLVAGRRPERQEMMVFGPEVKAYYSQWATITLCDGLLYRQWQTPDGKATLLQLLVPRSLQHQVLRLVHGSVGTDHFGVAMTLRGAYWLP